MPQGSLYARHADYFNHFIVGASRSDGLPGAQVEAGLTISGVNPAAAAR